MKLWAALTNAYTGWLLILRGDPQWRQHFAMSLPGLVTSIVIFLFCAFLAIALASTYQGMPGLLGMLDALMAQCLWIIAILSAIRVTATILKTRIVTIDLLVPAIYLLVFYLALGSLINLVFPLGVLLLTLALAYPLYRLARTVALWPAANAVGFAVLAMVLLVGMPQALYMLSNLAAPSI